MSDFPMFSPVIKEAYSTVIFFSSTRVKFGIIQKPTPTKSHNSLGAREQYYAPLRKIYKKIRIEHPDLDKEVALNVANHRINVTADSEGLIPSLLVSGAFRIFHMAMYDIYHLTNENALKRWSLLGSKWNRFLLLNVTKSLPQHEQSLLKPSACHLEMMYLSTERNQKNGSDRTGCTSLTTIKRDKSRLIMV